MGDHVHAQLRAAAKTALTGLATTGANVHASRPEDQTLPTSITAALVIYTDTGSAEPAELTEPEVSQETVTLRIEAVCRIADFDDIADQIKLEVQMALAGGLTVAGVPLKLSYRGFDNEYDARAGMPQATCVMRFETVLFYAQDAPDTLQQYA